MVLLLASQCSTVFLKQVVPMISCTITQTTIRYQHSAPHKGFLWYENLYDDVKDTIILLNMQKNSGIDKIIFENSYFYFCCARHVFFCHFTHTPKN